MLVKIKRILKDYPRFYKILQIIYRKTLELIERLFGTKIQERRWARRHLLEENDWNNPEYSGKKDGWVLSYWASRGHGHRQFLLGEIEKFLPFSTVLEIGSNCGPNLYLLAKRFPRAEVVGIDINKRAIEIGKRAFDESGISNVELLVGTADELSRFRDKKFDIVFTDAVLMYIGPDRINKTIGEMLRIAKKGIILLEQHIEDRRDSRGLGLYQFGFWQRNYKRLLRQFVPEERVHFAKIPEELWKDANWMKSGYVIQVRL